MYLTKIALSMKLFLAHFFQACKFAYQYVGQLYQKCFGYIKTSQYQKIVLRNISKNYLECDFKKYLIFKNVP